MPATKPDYGDAGYGQVGCLLVVAGIAIGAVVSSVLLVWLTPALPAGGDAVLVRLAGICALAVVVGTALPTVLGKLIERVPALWSSGDAVYLAAFVGSLVTVPIALYVPAVGALAWPIVGVAAVIAYAPMVWIVIVRLWRGPVD
jgi:hypothetical protein